MVYDSHREWFWDRVDRNGPAPSHLPDLGPCWLWTRAADSKGYGKTQFGRAGKQLRVHRIAWVLTNGPIPDGLRVLHRCDIRLCCRPDHLFLGTDLDNARDKTAKGRNWTPLGRHINVGSDHPLAKLTESQVIEIRARLAAREPGYKIARAFDVSEVTISRIRRGTHWKHVAQRPENLRHLGHSALTYAQVEAVLARAGESHGVIAADFGVSRSTISRVLSGKYHRL